MVKLSIIIPIYNVENYLRRCLDSVLLPERSDYEIIAVNDGSTDGSGAIAREYAGRFPALIRLIEKPNGGLGHARNTGLARAQGEYVLFLDSDDRLVPGSVEEMLDTLAGGAEIYVFDFFTENENGRVLEHNCGCGQDGTFALAEYPELLFERPNAWNKLWKRSLFTANSIAFPDRMWYEDLATSPRLYLRAASIRHVPREYYAYLQRSGSIINSASAERNTEIITAVDMVEADFREQGQYERYREALEYMTLYHQLLMAGTRVSQIDPNSPVLDTLLEDFLQRHPDYRKNPYLKQMGRKHRLLVELLIKRRRREVRALMRLNSRVKRKEQ